MPEFTVIGIYTEPFGQRFATSIQAETPQEAEALAIEDADGELVVAGVVAGDVELLDCKYATGLETNA